MQSDIKEFFDRHGSGLREENSVVFAAMVQTSNLPWRPEATTVCTFANCILATAKISAKYHALPHMFTYGALPEVGLVRLDHESYSRFIKPIIARSRDRKKCNMGWDYEKTVAKDFLDRFSLHDTDNIWVKAFKEGNVTNIVALNTILMHCVAINVPTERAKTV